MHLKPFAKFGLPWLFLPSLLLAESLIIGTEEADVIFGTDGDDEIHGGAGNDEIRGGAGNDTLIGGKGVDKIWGGAGSDNFVIVFLSELPDNLMDFSVEEGDTVTVRIPEITQTKSKSNMFKINNKGIVTVQLIDGTIVEAADLKRSDLSLRIDPSDKEVRLSFFKNF